MTITVLQENLLPKLQDAGRFIASKPQLPILSGVYLSCEQKNLVIRATDLKVGYQATIGGKVESEGICVVPLRVFAELVASLRPGPVELSLNQSSLTIAQGKVKSTLSTFPPIDFPPFPQAGELSGTLPAKDFSQGIDQVFYAASLDETRPIIASILISFEEKVCTLAATDGYRLAVKRLQTEGVEKPQSVLIQAKMLAEIARIIGKGSTTDVSFYVTQELQQACFQIDDVMMIVRLTEGTFPNYQAIIPPHFAISTVLDREQLIHALKTALVVAKESSSIITMGLAKNVVHVMGVSQSVGENCSDIESSYAGEEERTIACNAKFLMDALSRMEKDDIELSVNEELKPIQLRGKDEENFIYIVMPFKK